MGSFKRDYATRFNVDPYNEQPGAPGGVEYKNCKAAAFGSWTASAAMIPISGTAGSVITGTSLGKSFNDILATEPPSRIRIINEGKLKQMGISDDLAKRAPPRPTPSTCPPRT